MESALADVFDSFYDGVEFKSGGVFIERMQRGDVSGTHRVVHLVNWVILELQMDKKLVKTGSNSVIIDLSS